MTGHPPATGGAEPDRLPPPGSRGRTEIADKVLQRIATQVLVELDQAGGSARRLLGVTLGRGDASAAPRVSAHVDGGLATMQMTVSVVYPASIRQVTGQLRERVTARIGELTGVQVRQVDIDVANLTGPQRPQARRVS